MVVYPCALEKCRGYTTPTRRGFCGEGVGWQAEEEEAASEQAGI